MTTSNTPSQKQEVPNWVKLALFGVPGRGSAVAMYWIAQVLGFLTLAAGVAGAGDAWMFVSAAIGFGTAVLTYQCIKTMDAADGWPKPGQAS